MCLHLKSQEVSTDIPLVQTPPAEQTPPPQNMTPPLCADTPGGMHAQHLVNLQRINVRICILIDTYFCRRIQYKFELVYCNLASLRACVLVKKMKYHRI